MPACCAWVNRGPVREQGAGIRACVDGTRERRKEEGERGKRKREKEEEKKKEREEKEKKKRGAGEIRGDGREPIVASTRSDAHEKRGVQEKRLDGD